MSVSILNTDANILSKTLLTAEGTATQTGLITFDRDPNPPFAVTAASTNVANLDADKVDGADYSIGTWTPVIGGSGGTSGQTYSTQIGGYVKMGRLVWASFGAALTAKGTITGTVVLSGLPFTVDSVYFASDCPQYAALATNWVNIVLVASPNTVTALVRGANAAGVANSTDLVTADISNTTSLFGSIVYRSSS
jgi:hypothetical protein